MSLKTLSYVRKSYEQCKIVTHCPAFAPLRLHSVKLTRRLRYAPSTRSFLLRSRSEGDFIYIRTLVRRSEPWRAEPAPASVVPQRACERGSTERDWDTAEHIVGYRCALFVPEMAAKRKQRRCSDGLKLSLLPSLPLGSLRIEATSLRLAT